MVMGPDGARKQETRNHISVLRWTKNLKLRDNLGNLSIDVTIILKETELEVADSLQTISFTTTLRHAFS
jgi:hypothetical protein